MSDPYDPLERWLTDRPVEPIAPPPGAFERITRSARRTRRVRGAGVTFAVLLAAAGAATLLRGLPGPGPEGMAGRHGTGEPTPSSATPSPGGQGSPDPASSAPDSPSPSATQSHGESASPGTPDSSTASGQPSASRCATAHLRVTAERGGGSAGHPAILLIFTNTGTQTCTMYGFPGASFLTAENGQEINQPAQRSAAITPTTVTLTPGTAAQATLRWSNPDLYDQATCHPATAAGVRVYPPDDTTAVFVTTEQQLCSASDTGRPEILPVEPR